jgi:predicted O-methyltransferase YrrM
MLELTEAVSRLITRGWVLTPSGERIPIRGAITRQEAEAIQNIIRSTGAKECLETGVATGVSTLAITDACRINDGHHWGVDPFQGTEHQYVGAEVVREFGLADKFTLLEGPGHLELPRLLEAGRQFDFIFIDGAHQFDYKFVDAFYAHRLLRTGGWLALHDLRFQSTRKVFRYLRTLDSYRLQPTFGINTPLRTAVRLIAASLWKRKAFAFWWPNSFGNLLLLEKLREHEFRWDEYRDF